MTTQQNGIIEKLTELNITSNDLLVKRIIENVCFVQELGWEWFLENTCFGLKLRNLVLELSKC